MVLWEKMLAYVVIKNVFFCPPKSRGILHGQTIFLISANSHSFWMTFMGSHNLYDWFVWRFPVLQSVFDVWCLARWRYINFLKWVVDRLRAVGGTLDEAFHRQGHQGEED